MKYAKTITVLAFLIFCSSLALAVEFDVEFQVIDNIIEPDGIAEYKITVYNRELQPQKFRIKSRNSLDYPIRTQPTQNPILLEIGPANNKSINIFVNPNEKKWGQGTWLVYIDVIAESTEEEKTISPKLTIISGEEVPTDYVTVVIPTVSAPKSILPTQDLEIEIVLDNQNKKDIQGAELVISSDFINEKRTINIAPDSETRVKINKTFDDKAPPAKDTIRVTMFYEGEQIFEPVIKTYEIKSYQKIEDRIVPEKAFLTKDTTATFTNIGNIPYQGNVRIQTSTLKRIFSTPNPPTDITKEDGQLYYSWPANLAPYESITVKVNENYLTLFIIVIVAVLVVIFLYLKRAPLIIKKEVTETDTTEGGLAKAKILITIKNRSLKKIEDISIVDKIPKLLDIDKHTTIGSMTPKKVKKNKKHETLILWQLEELTPSEERVISYYIKSNLQILGGLTLQAAHAKYKEKDKTKSIRSNRLIVKV